MDSSPSTTVKSVCPYCGVGCGVVMEVRQGRVIKIAGDKTHPTNFGRLCTKGSTCAQAIADSGRMEQAFVRHERAREPVRTALADAIRETGRRLRAIVDEHGPDAVSLYVSGQMSLEAQYLANKLAKGFIRTRWIESNSRLCMASAGSGYKLSLGSDGPPGSYQDFDRADLFFVVGANMADCHPILFLRMMDRVKAGATLIVVDPRRTATADKASLYLQIKPGTDLALLNGLLHLLHANGRTDAAFIAAHTEGWDAMPAFLADYTPERVAQITGLPEADIRAAAAQIGDAKDWMSCWTMGLNQSTHGTWNTNAICNLHLATGAICRPGSGPFSLTGQPNAMGGREMGYMGPGLPGQRSALVADDRAFVEDLWDLPRDTLRPEAGGGTVAMFEEMQAGAIKACWIICTNPVATVPNRASAIAGLRAAELVITQDAFLDTETNRYADILLPGALWAEAEGVMINSERNLTLMAQAVPPPGEAMADWRLIARVATEMGYGAAFDYASVAEVFEEIKGAWNPKTGYDLRGASHERLRATPLQWPCPPDDDADRHPIRYLNDGTSQALHQGPGGEVPRIAFATASGRGVFLPRPHLPPAEMPDVDFPVVLNTGRLQHQWHTMTKTGKIATLNKLNPGPFVEVHPEDAQLLGLGAGDAVEVRSRRGRAVLPALVTDRVRPGNCFAPFHWNDVFGEGLAINAVTSDAVDPLSLQPEFKFCAVVLSRVEAAPAPAVHESAPAKSSGDPADAPSARPPTREFDMKHIDALAALLGLDAAPPLSLEEDERLYMQGYLTGLRADAGRQAGGVPVLPPGAPIAPARRLVVDGMLAGLFARTWLPEPAMAIAAQPAVATPLVTLLWASQTGNAQDRAERFAQRLQAAGHAVQACGLDAVEPSGLTAGARVLVLASTFGDGEPPDNAAAFWSRLNDAAAPRLDGVRFGVLAFGDSSYDQFCGFGRKLDARLEALGATRLLARIDCEPDDDEPAQAWMERALQVLAETAVPAAVAAPAAAAATVEEGASPEPELAAPAPACTRAAPLRTRLLANRLLSGPGASKEVRQVAFDLAGSGLRYEAGDALGVWPVNCPALVGDMLSALALPASAPVTVKGVGELPLADALLRQVEIARVSPEVLRFVAERSGSPVLADLLREERKPALKDWLWGRQVVDLLQDFPIRASAQEWLGVLKRLQPRLYSISSSPKATPDEVQLTMSTVRYACEGRARGGVCSSFLADRAAGAEVGLFVQPTTHFRPPADADRPMIMVGPGTGVAPFRAFLQERQATGARGRNWLIFGEQRAATDFYYRDELEALQRGGVLHHLDTAFSRDQADKVYVQHRMAEQGARLWAWLQEGAHFYVCGDAGRMAADVDAALRKIVQQHGAMGEAEAAAYVARLGQDRRYVRDVY